MWISKASLSDPVPDVRIRPKNNSFCYKAKLQRLMKGTTCEHTVHVTDGNSTQLILFVKNVTQKCRMQALLQFLSKNERPLDTE
jgi:hypothetical protein